jgi:hypothetical protein
MWERAVLPLHHIGVVRQGPVGSSPSFPACFRVCVCVFCWCDRRLFVFSVCCLCCGCCSFCFLFDCFGCFCLITGWCATDLGDLSLKEERKGVVAGPPAPASQRWCKGLGRGPSSPCITSVLLDRGLLVSRLFFLCGFVRVCVLVRCSASLLLASVHYSRGSQVAAGGQNKCSCGHTRPSSPLHHIGGVRAWGV